MEHAFIKQCTLLNEVPHASCIAMKVLAVVKHDDKEIMVCRCDNRTITCKASFMLPVILESDTDETNRLRAKYIKEHGRCCSTCNHDPANHGQRDTCAFTYALKDDGVTTKDVCQHYVEATYIYSIDIPYCC